MSATLRADVRPIDPRRREPLFGAERLELLVHTAAELRELIGGRRVVNINSTATGGGVAEMLATLIGYVRGCGYRTEPARSSRPYFSAGEETGPDEA